MVRYRFILLLLFSVFFYGCGFFPSTVVDLEIAKSSDQEGDFSVDVQKNALGFDGKKKVDVLFVLDTSYPMVKHLQRVDETFKNFIEYLSPIAWRMAFTNADYDSNAFAFYNRDLFHGRTMLLELNGIILSHAFLYPYSNYSKRIFLDTLKRYEVGDVDRFSSGQYMNPCDLPPYCQGSIRSPIRSLISSFSVNKNLVRKDAVAFVAVIFTNGDDLYVRGNVAGLFISEFQKHYGVKKKARVYSISIIPGDQGCLRHDQSTHYNIVDSTYGTNIYKLVQGTGGKAMSICSPDYSSLASTIAHSL